MAYIAAAMLLHPLAEAVSGATTASTTTLVVGALFSGAAIASVFNNVYAFLKDRTAIRQQRLEQIQQATFTLTWAIETPLAAHLGELIHRKTLLDYKRGYTMVSRGAGTPEWQEPVDKDKFSQSELDACNERIRQLRKDFPKEKTLSELEVFVRLASIYFPELRGERLPLADYVMEVLRLHDHDPERQTTNSEGQDETVRAQILVLKLGKLRGQLLRRVWELPQPSLLPWLKLSTWKRLPPDTWGGSAKPKVEPPRPSASISA